MRRFFLIGLVLLSIGCASSMAQAGSFETKMVVTRTSSDILEMVIKRFDPNYQVIRDGAYRFKLSGYKVVLFDKKVDIQLYAGFSARGTSLADVNEWNKSKRFSRAYIDNEGDPVIESDLDFEGGVTAEAIVQFVKIFAKSVKRFASEI